MSGSEEQDKTEQATPYKLEQARKKGQVSKSIEVNSIVSLTVFCLLAMVLFNDISKGVSQMVKRYFIGAGQIKVDNNSIMNLFLNTVVDTLTLFSPILVALILVGIGVTIMQTKPVFTSEPLKPNFSKLNPAAGLKKIFSMKTLFEFVKTCLKLSAIGTLIYLGFSAVIPDILMSTHILPNSIGDYWFLLFVRISFTLIVILVPFAILDFIFTKKEFAKKMRMSMRDIKDEVKRRDGDPEVRKKRKQIQNELLKKTSSIANVKDSDVILTNPTHFAVALKYKPHEMIAPIVVAKGSDLLADKIKRVALEYNIPILRQPKLARKIFKETEIEQPVLENNYAEIAPIFRWVFELKGRSY